MQKRFINDCLTIRYQYNENIATLKVLIPAVAGYGVMIILGVGISIWAFVVLIQTNKNSLEIQLAFQVSALRWILSSGRN
jgi:prolipoprotein diacylglyceryltransferase